VARPPLPDAVHSHEKEWNCRSRQQINGICFPKRHRAFDEVLARTASCARKLVDWPVKTEKNNKITVTEQDLSLTTMIPNPSVKDCAKARSPYFYVMPYIPTR
jgi:hypothetical protein